MTPARSVCSPANALMGTERMRRRCISSATLLKMSGRCTLIATWTTLIINSKLNYIWFYVYLCVCVCVRVTGEMGQATVYQDNMSRGGIIWYDDSHFYSARGAKFYRRKSKKTYMYMSIKRKRSLRIGLILFLPRRNNWKGIRNICRHCLLIWYRPRCESSRCSISRSSV